jgi:DNA-binding NarL/FixJ family response regulator
MTQRARIRVLIADDQRLMLDGLQTLLELEPDLEVVDGVEDGAAAVDAFERLQPDVVLMDGVEATRRICQPWPGARVIILTTFDDDAYVFEGVRVGASGHLLKAIEGSELAQAIRTVAAGDSFLEPSVARKLM